MHKINTGEGTLKLKEFQECYNFAVSVQKNYGRTSIDYVIDVAGGHGALASLLLVMTGAKEAVVVDPALCAAGVKGVAAAWGSMHTGKVLRYRNEGLETALAEEIYHAKRACGEGLASRVVVVACHACQFLTDEVLDICEAWNVNVAVMPCCQKVDPSLKAFAKAVKVEVGAVSDLMAAGRMMKNYKVKVRVLAKAATPQNRLIMCTLKSAVDLSAKEKSLRTAKDKLERVYHAAHKNGNVKVIASNNGLVKPAASASKPAGEENCAGGERYLRPRAKNGGGDGEGGDTFSPKSFLVGVVATCFILLVLGGVFHNVYLVASRERGTSYGEGVNGGEL